jgi:hypothetical protein
MKTEYTTNIIIEDSGCFTVFVKCKYCCVDIGNIDMLNYNKKIAEQMYNKHVFSTTLNIKEIN